jgi:DNA (cytosine-5)-methyltransferase 3A
MSFLESLPFLDLFKSKKEFNVLSLFDGISCGQIALNRAGVNYNTYYASEIDDLPMRMALKNYPDTIQLGDVTKVKIDGLKKIDLVIGGSPCQGFSFAGKQLNFQDERSKLFFEFVRILEDVRKVNPDVKFLLENVKMAQDSENVITEILGVQPIRINSSLVSAQSRERLYWTNIPVDSLPEDKKLTIKDILIDNTRNIFTDERITKTKRKCKNYVQWDLSGKGYNSQQDRAFYMDGKMGTVPKSNPANKVNIVLDYENDIYRRLVAEEVENLQNVPLEYTKIDGVKDHVRIGALGNGWTVDIIVHIFKGLL